MRCSKCGFDNNPEMQFCGKCGNKLAGICPDCGFENPPEHIFCGKCGARLAEALTTTPPRLEDMQKQLQDRIPHVRSLTPHSEGTHLRDASHSAARQMGSACPPIGISLRMGAQEGLVTRTH